MVLQWGFELRLANVLQKQFVLNGFYYLFAVHIHPCLSKVFAPQNFYKFFSVLGLTTF